MSKSTLKNEFNQRDQIEQLQEELKKYISIPKKRDVLEKFFVHENIFNLEDINKITEEYFLEYLKENKIYNKSKINSYLYGLKVLKKEYQRSQYKQLIIEIEECNIDKRLKSNVQNFLMNMNIKSIAEINYEIRQQYIKHLENTIIKRKIREYTKVLDKLKLYNIKKEEEKNVFRKPKWIFKEEKVFLLYYPVYELAMSFYFVQDKEELLWDFSINTSIKLKQQIFYMLIYAINEIKDIKDRRVRFLLPLKWLYFYCIEKEVEDIEKIEKWQIEEFYKVVSDKVAMVDNSMQIIDNIRKQLFLSSKKINWEANVWYIERFYLAKERINPSNPVKTLSFLEILNLSNRKLLQEYIKYLIGVTDFSIQSIRTHFYSVANLLKYLDKINYKVEKVTCIEIKQYIEELEKKEILPNTFNKVLIFIFQFFRFLKLKGKIEKIPFFIEYYLKQKIITHHNRSVPQNIIKMILDNLYQFPLVLRLMFLHLWCIGLRINEVCTLKGNAYEWREGAAWISVYQNKMRLEKRVPIPTMLYKIMLKYIKENNIGIGDYIFQDKKGEAYKYGTFVKQMTKQLNKYNVISGEYIFRTHDFRHTVATSLYVNGASIQAIRDYLGHDREDMTMQYIDYLPEKIQKANEEYFNEVDNLADCLKGE